MERKIQKKINHKLEKKATSKSMKNNTTARTIEGTLKTEERKIKNRLGRDLRKS